MPSLILWIRIDHTPFSSVVATYWFLLLLLCYHYSRILLSLSLSIYIRCFCSKFLDPLVTLECGTLNFRKTTCGYNINDQYSCSIGLIDHCLKTPERDFQLTVDQFVYRSVNTEWMRETVEKRGPNQAIDIWRLLPSLQNVCSFLNQPCIPSNFRQQWKYKYFHPFSRKCTIRISQNSHCTIH